MGMFSSHLTPCRSLCPAFSTLWELLRDGLQFLTTISHSRAALAAEILLLRKQFAYYREHRIRPRRLRDASRLCLLFWSRLFDWQAALVVVKMSTFIRWHRKGCTGDGSREVAAHRSRKRFGSSSLVWSEKT